MSTVAHPAHRPRSGLQAAVFALIASVWTSCAIFGVYIVVFYCGAAPAAQMEDWNASLPRLYEPQTPAASVGMGLHFIAGSILLLLGPTQLMPAVRRRAPRLHRRIGQIYALAAFVAGGGGLAFIALKGTVGGWPMTLGFSLYGAGMVLASIETVRHAMGRRLNVHRAWAMRLFALAIGSWLYRICYAVWFGVARGEGHTAEFSGWFDWVMDFAFFVPPLLIAELCIRTRGKIAHPVRRALAAGAVASAAAVVALATSLLTVLGWGPAIAMRFGG